MQKWQNDKAPQKMEVEKIPHTGRKPAIRRQIQFRGGDVFFKTRAPHITLTTKEVQLRTYSNNLPSNRASRRHSPLKRRSSCVYWGSA